MSTIRLLVCDDDRGNCHLVSHCLQAEGFDVDVAGNGEDALKLLRRNHYHLAILDYQMPGMDGVQLYQRIHEQSPGTLGIFLTAFTTLDIVYPAINAGVESVLAKPVDLNELRNLVISKVGKPSGSASKTSSGDESVETRSKALGTYLPPSSAHQS